MVSSKDWRQLESEIAEQAEYVTDLENQVFIAKNRLKVMKEELMQLKEQNSGGKQLLQG